MSGRSTHHQEKTLRCIIEGACHDLELSLGDLTVLSVRIDPYRLDTPAAHGDGEWLAEQLDRLYGPTKRVHWRGLHYALVAAGQVRKPNGAIYVSTDDDWCWLSETAGTANAMGAPLTGRGGGP